MARRKSKTAVRESLMEQLMLMGADVTCFEDLVDKYMELWDIDRQLTRDIKKRGVAYEDKSSTGVVMMKNNPSVKEKVAVNRQMLAILNQLKITTEGAGEACANDERL